MKKIIVFSTLILLFNFLYANNVNALLLGANDPSAGCCYCQGMYYDQGEEMMIPCSNCNDGAPGFASNIFAVDFDCKNVNCEWFWGSQLAQANGMSACEEMENPLGETIIETEKGQLGCYCKIDNNEDKKLILNTDFDTQAECTSANQMSTILDIGALTECEWNVSGEQEINVEGGKKTEVVIPNASDLNKLGTTDMATVIGKAIKLLTGILGSIALIMILYGGFLWMTSGGNAEKTKKAIDILVWSSLGIVVILASYGLVEYIFEAFKYK